MADVCVLFISNDRDVTRELVSAIATEYSVWSSDEIAAGDWEETVRLELRAAKVVVVVVSKRVRLPRAGILFDELRLAKRLKVPILPFRIGKGDLPLGIGALSEVMAEGATGRVGEGATTELLRRVGALVATSSSKRARPDKTGSTTIGLKALELPAFIFSASSFETQITPEAAVGLLSLLRADALLVSAYDVWMAHENKRDTQLLQSLAQVRSSTAVLVLDSGNYEAARIRAVVPRGARFRWTRQSFHATCRRVNPDAVFSFDQHSSATSIKAAAKHIVDEFMIDRSALKKHCRELWPIVHVPRGTAHDKISSTAAELVHAVAKSVGSRMIAIPERELGDDLRARVETVGSVRLALNALSTRCALHILGTGNPIAINALAAAGADSFDGLEWCRTITDYDKGFLFHFRHLNLFEDSAVRRVRGHEAKQLVTDGSVSYELRALALNIDYWQDLMRSIRGLVRSGQVDALVRSLPFDGRALFPARGLAT